MSNALARMARSITQHWKRSLAVSFISVVLLGALAGATGGTAASDFNVPGTDSQKAIDLFRNHTPALAGADAQLVFTVKDGRITDASRRQPIDAALNRVKALPGVAAVNSPFAGGGGAVSRDGRLATAEVRYDKDAAGIDNKDGQALESAARTAERNGVSVAMRGQVVDAGQQQNAPVGELIGIAIAFVLLTILFRSFAAMAATLIGALVGVMVGQLLLTILAKPLGLPEFASTIAIMLGLGAGIDYSLLIIARFREQLFAGDSSRDASAKAAATSGASVVAAGLIVMVAIAGLLVTGIPLIGKMGIAAAIGVAAVVVSALTILPALIGAFARWLRPKNDKTVRPSPMFGRWGEIITARPWLSVGAGVLILLVFAFPMTGLRLGQPDDGNQPASATQRVAYDQLGKAFGAGSNGPFLLAVDVPKGSPRNAEELARLGAAVKRTPGVASVAPPALSRDGEMATITAIPTTSPQDARTSDLLAKLRKDVIPAATKGTQLKVYVGGNTAGFEDFSDKVASRLPVFIAVVIGLSVLLLMVAFRSLWIPLVSAVFNLLSIGAAYGVVTAVFQDGFGASLLGVDSGVPIVSFIPVMMFAILFGLSMDYNVFLLSRMHEAYNEGAGPRESVVTGMARIGKVVLFAGLIMASVFLAFVTQSDVIAKMFGLGLGLAILIDVLVVRLLVAPAVVTLLGDRAWWLPAWLDRILPDVSLEGHLVEGVDRPAPEAEPEPEREPVPVGV
jgi:RND superfamily putative drug exporter